MPKVIDFARSFMTFFLPVNVARIHLDAACTIRDERTGETTDYFLIVPCRAEDMYLARDLFLMPNYEFCGIFSRDDCLLLRTHWQSDRDNREYGLNTVRFRDVRLDIRRCPAEVLSDDAAIVSATLNNDLLVAQTILRDAASQRTAIIHYPIKTMNVLPAGSPYTAGGPRFQVDTGPLLWPDLTAAVARTIECFDLAHAVYNTTTHLECLLRRPVGIGSGQATVTDYSLRQTYAVENTILRIVE